MTWDTTELKARFGRVENVGVIQYLERHHLSAHSDVAEEMFMASDWIKDRQYHCPNGLQCSYCFLHTHSGVIYALAVGMKNLTFKLPNQEIPKALAEGGQVFTAAGNDWVSFDPFRVDETAAKTRARMKQWCKLAYEWAGSIET